MYLADIALVQLLSVSLVPRLLILPLLFGLVSPMQAEIDPKVREACLPATDFLGCIKAYTSKLSDMEEKRVIQEKIELIGNKCPEQYLYSGAGNCQLIICRPNTLSHDPVLKNKDMYCKGMFKHLHFDDQVLKAVLDPKCPNKEPNLFSQSSCTTQENIGVLETKIPNQKTIGYRNSKWNKRHNN